MAAMKSKKTPENKNIRSSTKKNPFKKLLVSIIIGFVAVAVEPKFVIFIMSLAYLASGIIPMIFSYLKKPHIMPQEKEKKWPEEGGGTVAER